jgi:hypothetical protein
VIFYAFLLHDYRTRYPNEMWCFTGSLRALHMKCHACLAVMRCLDEMSCFFASDVFVLMVVFREVGEVDVEGCGRLRVHDSLLDVA